MTQYLHQFVLFAAAVVIGGLAFVPTLATARRKLLLSAGLLTGSALLWQ
jgi:hypothetical protein